MSNPNQETVTIKCPYCGTIYKLEGEIKPHGY